MPETKPNSRIEQLFTLETDLAIDYEFACGLMTKYMRDMHLLTSKAVEFKDLGYSELRKAQMTQVILGTGLRFVPMSEDFTGEKGIGHFKLSGMMRADGGLSSRGINSLADDIRALASDPNIMGGILEVRSGGGRELDSSYFN